MPISMPKINVAINVTTHKKKSLSIPHKKMAS
uniref:Uncharacterized protein n=1 Tax=Arundo donax TaxID=35708 RepID=A0A0A9H4D8_ARUDO